MLLHMLCRHPNVWSLLVDMVVVLYPKALIHKDAIGALPLHHAAAHDNSAALEIVFSAYKEGVNDVDAEGRQPLHVAAEFDAVDGVKFLLEKAPEGAYTMVHRPKEKVEEGFLCTLPAVTIRTLALLRASWQRISLAASVQMKMVTCHFICYSVMVTLWSK